MDHPTQTFPLSTDYPENEVVPSHSSDFSGVVNEADISFCRPIEFGDLNRPKAA